MTRAQCWLHLEIASPNVCAWQYIDLDEWNTWNDEVKSELGLGFRLELGLAIVSESGSCVGFEVREWDACNEARGSRGQIPAVTLTLTLTLSQTRNLLLTLTLTPALTPALTPTLTLTLTLTKTSSNPNPDPNCLAATERPVHLHTT